MHSNALQLRMLLNQSWQNNTALILMGNGNLCLEKKRGKNYTLPTLIRWCIYFTSSKCIYHCSIKVCAILFFSHLTFFYGKWEEVGTCTRMFSIAAALDESLLTCVIFGGHGNSWRLNVDPKWLPSSTCPSSIWKTTCKKKLTNLSMHSQTMGFASLKNPLVMTNHPWPKPSNGSSTRCQNKNDLTNWPWRGSTPKTPTFTEDCSLPKRTNCLGKKPMILETL